MNLTASSRRRRAPGTGPLLVLAAIAALLAAPCAQGYSARVTVHAVPTTRPLPDGFLGTALEFSTIPRWMGTGPAPADPVLGQLVANLDPGGRPVIRVGGQSTDRTWWPVPGMTRPPGVTYTLTPRWTQAAQNLAASLDARLLLGINLEARSTRVERVEAEQLSARIAGRYLTALEPGNEPTLYGEVPWYRVAGGRVLAWYGHAGTPVFGRGPGWGPAAYAREFAQALRVLPPGIGVAGPETGRPPWLDAIRPFLVADPRVRILTSHAYALNQCVRQPSAPEYPSVAHLLSRTASRSLLASAAPYVAVAHSHRAGYRIDELGSVSCNGRTGVSDTFASALWLADALFSLARSGVDGVNLHSYPDSVNGLFDLTHSSDGWSADVHPLYYGALLFARAAPRGSRLLAIGDGGRDPLRAWATLGPDGALRVLLINDSLREPASVQVQTPAQLAHGPGELSRLTAPGAAASSGVALGGQSFGPATTTGALPPPSAAPVAPSAGAYPVRLPAASAALLTLNP